MNFFRKGKIIFIYLVEKRGKNGIGFDLRIIIFQLFAHYKGSMDANTLPGPSFKFGIRPVNPVSVRVKLIERNFIPYKEYDDDAAGDGQCQSEYIDEWEDLIFKNVSKGDLKIIAKHNEID